jgi:hypothetical protein
VVEAGIRREKTQVTFRGKRCRGRIDNMVKGEKVRKRKKIGE